MTRTLLTALLCCFGATSTALAQDDAPEGGFDAHGFQLAAFDGDVRDGLSVIRPGAFHQGDAWFGVEMQAPHSMQFSKRVKCLIPAGKCVDFVLSDRFK